jgi:hypothetical protein
MPREIAVVVQISEFNAASGRIGGGSPHKVFIRLAIALRNRLQSINNALGKALPAESIKRPSWAILAHVMQYCDDAFIN